MKLLPAVFILLLSMTWSAKSDFRAGPAFVLPELIVLECHPSLDRSDPDPIVKIMVTANFDLNAGGAITNLSVVHVSFNGNKYDRSAQYAITPQLKSKPGFFEWYWSGVRTQDTRYTMRGRLFHNNAGWWYQETQYKNGIGRFNETSHCEEVGD